MKTDFTIELAPMEGITTYIYRRALNRHFGGIDIFYSPFIETHKNKEMSYKEINDIKPENNEGMVFIPQILTNDAVAFHITAEKIAEFGYNRFNLNLGCPSGTVTAKRRGAGMLQDPEELDRLLDGIFSKELYDISIKTRIGYEFEEEWEDIIKVYANYPISKLIVHPRVREDFYKGSPRLDTMRLAFEIVEKSFPLVYNGDVFSVSAFGDVVKRFPHVNGVMLGRGIIGNPILGADIRSHMIDSLPQGYIDSIENIDNTEDCNLKYPLDMEKVKNPEFQKKFRDFHNELLEEYRAIMPGDKPVLFKMKELWSYMYTLLPNPEKNLKQLRKCENCAKYKALVNSLLS